MFLVVKNKEELFLALEGSDAIVGAVFASLREVYKEIELDIVFNRPNCKVINNIVNFINLLTGEEKKVEKETESIKEAIVTEAVVTEIEEAETLELEETKANINIDRSKKEEIIKEEITIEEKPMREETVTLEIEEKKEEPKKEEKIIEKTEPVIVKRVDPAERALEKIKEQQRQEGLPKLDNKVNTLEYRKYLENFMKLGFTATTLAKKVGDMNDRDAKSKITDLCDASMIRVERYEEKFREIGLTTAQIHTFRMEALREVKKYRDSSYEEVYKYLRKLYDLSEELINELN